MFKPSAYNDPIWQITDSFTISSHEKLKVLKTFPTIKTLGSAEIIFPSFKQKINMIAEDTRTEWIQYILVLKSTIHALMGDLMLLNPIVGQITQQLGLSTNSFISLKKTIRNI